jgi:hypothetical protein
MELGINQKIWVETLKSGKYNQCTERLCSTDYKGNKSYCCLGLAVELFPSLVPINDTNLCGAEFKAVLGLRSWNGDFDINGNVELYNLAMMNDSGKTFQQIAEFIEQNPELVFSKSV